MAPPAIFRPLFVALGVFNGILFMVSCLVAISAAFVTFIFTFSPLKAHRAACWGAAFTWGTTVKWSRKFGGMPFIISGDKIDKECTAFVSCNHRTFADWMGIAVVGMQCGMHGFCKYFAKSTLIYLPFVGLGMKILGFPMLQRNYDKDIKAMQKTFSFLSKVDTPFWLVSFLEGSRLTPKKLQQSIEFAKKRNLPVLKHVMLPRTKGFVTSMKALSHRFEYVIDFTLGYPDNRAIPIVEVLGALCTKPMHVHVRKIPISQLDLSSEEALTKFVYDLYEEKDRLLDYFYKNGRFPQQEDKASVVSQDQAGAAGSASVKKRQPAVVQNP